MQDQEIKFGYAVTGVVDPARILTNAGAKPGDVLILTKPLGTGVIATALKFAARPAAAVTPRDRVDADAEPGRRGRARTLPAGGRSRLHRHHRVRPGRPWLGDGGRQQLRLAIDAGRGAAARRRQPLCGATCRAAATNRQHFAATISIRSTVAAIWETLLLDPQTSGGAPGCRSNRKTSRRPSLSQTGVSGADRAGEPGPSRGVWISAGCAH